MVSEQFLFEGGWRVLSMCISYFCVAMIKHHDKKQIQEEFLLAFCSRGLDVHNAEEAMLAKTRS